MPPVQQSGRSNARTPPRTLAYVFMAFGVLASIPGVLMLLLTLQPWFLLIGLGVLTTGVLLLKGSKVALVVYGLTFVGLTVLAVVDGAIWTSQAFARFAVPTALGLVLLRQETRDSLA